MATILSYALTNLIDVKESMGLASSDHSWDNLIIRKINQVTRQIEAYCGRHFLETTYTQEEYNSTQIDQFALKQRPITTTTPFVFEVRDNSLNINNWETIDSQLYFVDTSSGVVDLLFRGIGGWNRWRFTYSAGYATIPDDLAEAASALAAYYTLHPDGSQVGIQEMREGSRQQRFGLNNHLLNFHNIMEQLGVNEIIDGYANFPLITDR